MAKLDFKTRDYEIESLAENFDINLVQAVLLRLAIHRGKYWANKNLGSRLYLLKRSKDVARNRLLAKQYATEALEDLIPERIQDMDVIATQSEQSRIDLRIELTKFTGEKQTIIYFVPVGG